MLDTILWWVPFLVSGSAELYQTEVTGITGPTVCGKRAKRVVKEECIEEVLHPLTMCCNEKCISLWKEKLGTNLSRAIISTERHAYAAMGEVARQHHYGNLVRSLLRIKTATATNGSGVIQKRRLSVNTCPHSILADVSRSVFR